ncbi:MAG TPA: hypothetical protein VKS24_07340 [Bradyrhizobium sp.]|nr:hypothetical protein [Bradyrhizobium sp.]
MNTISDVSVSTPAGPETETEANLAMNVVAIICGLVIVVFACMATSGLDMSVGFF